MTALPERPIDPGKVKDGREEDLGYMRKMHVRDRVPRSEAARDDQGNIVGTGRVYVDKGDKVRCRLVAQEFARSDKRKDLYAGTPPLSCHSLPFIQYCFDMLWIKLFSEPENHGP